MEYWVGIISNILSCYFRQEIYSLQSWWALPNVYNQFLELPSWYARKQSDADSGLSEIEEFKRYRLRNSMGYEVDVLSLGATVTAIKVIINCLVWRANYI